MSATERTTAPIAPPSRLTLAGEGRGLFDLATLLPAAPWLMTAPRGETQAVLVLPGLGADDRSTAPLRTYLSVLGYDVHGWGLDRANRSPDYDLAAIATLIGKLADTSGKPVSLVGWSRGGILAREAARQDRGHVRQVITLGSPFAAPDATNVSMLWRLITGIPFSQPSRAAMAALAAPIPVPATAIYTKADGVVAWRACLEQEGPQAENIAVRSTHLGLGFHAPALWVIADRLAQPFGTWRPFRPGLLTRAFFPGLRN